MYGDALSSYDVERIAREAADGVRHDLEWRIDEALSAASRANSRIDEMRAELGSLREDCYERLDALEARVAALEKVLAAKAGAS